MRLINTKTLDFEEFIQDTPKYIILSHTWGDEEVSFQEYTWLREYEKELTEGSDSLEDVSPRQRLRTENKARAIRARTGYVKIKQFINLVNESFGRYDAGYVWVDTCCIDKTSSAELSEAINSMFTWYQWSQACIAYLSDILHLDQPAKNIPEQFENSRWFTRGWTLQELLAPPRELYFYDRDWNLVGDKDRLRNEITRITGVEAHQVTGFYESQALAKTMMLAANRSTTRIEDQAYCLLGLFHVNIPLLYGEGPRAFQRLQQQILTETEDITFLAWGYRVGLENQALSLLSSSPRDFVHCHHIRLNLDHEESQEMDPFQMTNKGLQITLELYRIDATWWTPRAYIAMLPCTDESLPRSRLALAITPYHGTIEVSKKARGTPKPVSVARIYVTRIAWFGWFQANGFRRDLYLTRPSPSIHVDGCGIEYRQEGPLSCIEVYPFSLMKPTRRINEKGHILHQIQVCVDCKSKNLLVFFVIQHKFTKPKAVVIVMDCSAPTAPGPNIICNRLRILRLSEVSSRQYSLAGLFLDAPSRLDPAYWFSNDREVIFSLSHHSPSEKHTPPLSYRDMPCSSHGLHQSVLFEVEESHLA